MRTSSTTQPTKLAGAIAKALRQGRVIQLTAIGVMANYLTIKGLACAREYLLEDGLGVRTEIAWMELEDHAPDGRPFTGLLYRVTAGEAGES
jgi:stage V sporulation protein SpoVS